MSQASTTVPVQKYLVRGLSFWLMAIYLFGVIVLALRLVAQLITILLRVLGHKDRVIDEDCIILNLQGAVEPCSFFRYIFINPARYDYETYEQILAHERVHARMGHTLDLLCMELAIVVLWFNPFRVGPEERGREKHRISDGCLGHCN